MSQLSLIHEEPSELASVAYCSAVLSPLGGEYLYAFERDAFPGMSVGSLVALPLGKRTVSGFIISIDSPKDRDTALEMRQRKITVKKIPRNASIVQAFTAEHLPFFEWVAKYYAEPLSKILDLAIPTPAWGRSDPLYRRSGRDIEKKLGTAQQRIVDFLSKHQDWVSWSAVREHTAATAATMRALVEHGLIEQASSEVIAEQTTPPPATLASLWDNLTPEQQSATAAIREHITTPSYGSFLLHGVTGSGKTEVYLELIIEALRRDRSALVIVPEIALTPQLTDRFQARLGQPVAVLHSSLKPSDRWQHWNNILSGRVKVAIGARSALFAPMKDLAVVVVDEEHDGSFKQGEGTRYNARDLALVRAKLASCPVVLGSATPSLETFHNATLGKHTRFVLSARFFKSNAPRFEIVDLSRIKPWEMPSKSISPTLLKGLQRTLAEGDQAFVLYNRRGFASYLQCSRCEEVVGCPHCSVTLTYHRKNNSLLCHFCGFSTVPPVVCGACGQKDPGEPDADPLFTQRGAGTERVFEELSTLLPSARIAKLDRDAVSSLQDYTNILQQVREHKVDILVGTQMIAKGHDLPNVTYVGVVDCDVGLHMPDFRAGERAFQLLTQVAGRAGRRGKQGHIVLQTRVPMHTSLQTTVSGDYDAFATNELSLRRTLGYPPFQRLLRIVVAAEDKAVAQRHATQLAALATPLCNARQITLLGPAVAPLEKVRNHWRYHLLFKSSSISVLQHVMWELKETADAVKNVRIIFDLEPQDML